MHVLLSSRSAAQVIAAFGVDDRSERADKSPVRQRGIDWRAPIGWSGLIVSASSAFGPSERCFPARADDIPKRYAA